MFLGCVQFWAPGGNPLTHMRACKLHKAKFLSAAKLEPGNVLLWGLTVQTTRPNFSPSLTRYRNIVLCSHPIIKIRKVQTPDMWWCITLIFAHYPAKYLEHQPARSEGGRPQKGPHTGHQSVHGGPPFPQQTATQLQAPMPTERANLARLSAMPQGFTDLSAS